MKAISRENQESVESLPKRGRESNQRVDPSTPVTETVEIRDPIDRVKEELVTERVEERAKELVEESQMSQETLAISEEITVDLELL